MNARTSTGRLVNDLKPVARDTEELLKASGREVGKGTHEARAQLAAAREGVRAARSRLEDQAVAGAKVADKVFVIITTLALASPSASGCSSACRWFVSGPERRGVSHPLRSGGPPSLPFVFPKNAVLAKMLRTADSVIRFSGRFSPNSEAGEAWPVVGAERLSSERGFSTRSMSLPPRIEIVPATSAPAARCGLKTRAPGPYRCAC